jgi:methylmalonyl-CoA/ethylmalonyl-CoA epimerase
VSGLGPLGQVTLGVGDADTAEAFYGGTLGLRKLYRFDTLVFFDMGGVRLMLGAEGEENARPGSVCLYFRVDDIAAAQAALEAKGVTFAGKPQLIAAMPDHELWMSFFSDPFGHQLALMCEKPPPRPAGG